MMPKSRHGFRERSHAANVLERDDDSRKVIALQSYRSVGLRRQAKSRSTLERLRILGLRKEAN